MSKQEMVVKPIIGRPDQVANAIEAQIRAGVIRSPEDVRIKHLDGGMVAAFMNMPAPTARPRRREDTVAQSMTKALLFGLAVLAVPLAAIAVIVAVVGIGRIVGFLAVLALLAIAVTWNRSNHAGACPGLHCDGCKHKH